MNAHVARILREETWRSVVWFGIALFGWATVLTGSETTEATAGTVLGLPVLTALVVASVVVGIRLATGRALQATGDVAYIAWAAATLAGSLLGIYYVLVLHGTPLVAVAVPASAAVGLYVLSTVGERPTDARSA